MRNISFLVALLCLLLNRIEAQSPGFRSFNTNTHILGNLSTMPTNAIADDFGPRNVGKAKFHAGVDFNCLQGNAWAQNWWMIVSPQAGIIADYDHLTNGADVYKYALVNVTDDEGNGSHTWLFGHVFDTLTQFYNKFNQSIVLNRCEIPNIDKWGLHLKMTDANGIVFQQTYGQIGGATFKVNGVNYTTTNVVNITDPFIPLGHSGGKQGERYVPHLHLNSLPYNTGTQSNNINGDPTQFLNIDRPDYWITAHSEGGNILSGIRPNYPGTSSTKVKVRVEMQGEALGTNRYNHLMDMDKVELQIKRSSASSYERVIGDQIEAIISEGGRLGEPVINHKNPINKSNWLSMGINSNAYNAATTGPNARNPWDDYYFTDFKTRIHNSDQFNNKTLIADIPANSRYPDGIYNIRVKATTSNNGIIYSPEREYRIDNFKPYIEQFKASLNGSAFYTLERIGNDSVINIADDGYVTNQHNQLDANITDIGVNLITIRAKTSEMMKDLKIAYKKEGDFQFSGYAAMNQNASDSLKWEANLFGVFKRDDILNVRITGVDISDNKILNIYDSSSKNTPNKTVKIPTRKGTGEHDWTNYQTPPNNEGTDQFDFTIKSCEGRSSSTDYCAILAKVNVTEEPYSCHISKIKVNGLENNYNDFDITWTVENGEIISEFEHTDEIEVKAGMYCYRIEALHSCCVLEGCIEVHQGNLNQFVEITTQVNGHACSGHSGIAKVSGVVVNGEYLDATNSNFTFKWSTGSNAVGIQAPAGLYTVTVTAKESGCSNTAEVTIEEIRMDLEAEITTAGCNGDGSIWIFPEYTHDFIKEENMRYQWSNGATSDYISNLQPGMYCVTVSNSAIGNCAFTKCFEIEESERNEYLQINNIRHNCICTDGSVGCNGLINLRLAGEGLQNITYKWYDSNNVVISELARIHSLCSGMYKLEVNYNKDGLPGECKIIEYFTIESVNCNSATVIRLNEILQNDNCGAYNNCSGLIDVSINVGIYTEILWSGPDNFTSTSQRIENLCPGIYNLNVYSPDGCFNTSASYLICCCNSYTAENGQTSSPSCLHEGYSPVRFIGEVENSTNAASSDGSIRLIFFGSGIGNLSINWTGPNGYIGQGTWITGLNPGEYKVTVNDGCDAIIRNFRVGDKEKCGYKNLKVEVIEHSCILSNLSPGTIVLKPTGGRAPYTFQWSDGTNKNVYSTTTPRTISVTITDNDGCTLLKTFEIRWTDKPLRTRVNIIKPISCNFHIEEIDYEIIIDSGNPPFLIQVNGQVHQLNTFYFKGKIPSSSSPSWSWQDAKIEVKITDDCGFKINQIKLVSCNELCPDNCIKITKTGAPNCTDFELDNLAGEWSYDKLKIKSDCNDNVVRHVEYLNYPVTGQSATFIGNKKESGIDSWPLNQWGNMYFQITNETTGCIQTKSYFVPPKCFNWIHICPKRF